jgi:hypothetical protein
VATLGDVSIYVRLRAEASERKRWQEAAERSFTGRRRSAARAEVLKGRGRHCGRAASGGNIEPWLIPRDPRGRNVDPSDAPSDYPDSRQPHPFLIFVASVAIIAVVAVLWLVIR